MKNDKEKVKNQTKFLFNKIKDFLLDIIFTVKCPYCNVPIERKESSCENCRKKFPDKYISNFAIGGYETVSPFPYEDIFLKAVINFKFHEKPYYAKQLSVELANTILKKYDISKIDCITFVPMHKKGLKKRHFNQAELLAKYCANILEIPCENLLEKYKDNKTQHSLNANQRKRNVMGVYRPISTENIKGKNILIIDDIITTGNTLGECCRILKEAECSKVVCATLCAVVIK